MQSQKFARMTAASLVLIVLLITNVSAVLDHCVFGADCPFQCNCSPFVDEPLDDCDKMTGTCPETGCVEYHGEVLGTSYTPWYEPGCQLGDVGLKKVMYVYDVNNTLLPIQYTFSIPYGDIDPQLCMYPNAPLQMSDLQFVIDFERDVYGIIFKAASKHESLPLSEAYFSGTCQYNLHMADSITDKRDEQLCDLLDLNGTNVMHFVCNKKGRYMIFTGQGCDLNDIDVKNLCIKSVSIFGYPVQDVDCSRCIEDNSTLMMTNIQLYMDEVNSYMVGPVEREQMLFASSVETSCGNGIWCEVCEAGWLPPDCRTPCPTGWYGVNCGERCENLPVPEQYHCEDTQNCDRVTGEFLDCFGLCQVWYRGIQCNLYIPPADTSPVVSSLLSGHNTVSFHLTFDVAYELAEFYSYMIEYSKAGNDSVHLYDSILQPSATSQLVEFIGLHSATEYRFNIVGIRRHQGIRESVISGDFNVTTGCLYPPRVDRYEQTDLYISWLSNATMDLCGRVEVNTVLVKQSQSNTWKKYTVSSDPSVLLLQNMAENVDEVKLQGDSSHGYQVMSEIVTVRPDISDTTLPDTIEQSQHDSSTSWNVNNLVILLLVCCIALVLTLIIQGIFLYRKIIAPETQQQEDNQLGFLTKVQPEQDSKTAETTESQKQLIRSADCLPPTSLRDGAPRLHSEYVQDDQLYNTLYETENSPVTTETHLQDPKSTSLTENLTGTESPQQKGIQSDYLTPVTAGSDRYVNTSTMELPRTTDLPVPPPLPIEPPPLDSEFIEEQRYTTVH